MQPCCIQHRLEGGRNWRGWGRGGEGIKNYSANIQATKPPMNKPWWTGLDWKDGSI